MAPKFLAYSSSFLLLLLLSNIIIANAALFTTSYLKGDLNSYEEAKIGAPARRPLHAVVNNHNNNNIPSSWHRVYFHVLPKGHPIPPSGASQRRNLIQSSDADASNAVLFHPLDLKTLHHKGHEDARVEVPVRRHAIDCIPRKMLRFLPKLGDPIPPPPPPPSSSKCHHKFV